MGILIDPPASYLPLVEHLSLTAGIPYVENWSACADFLGLIAQNILTEKPANILECGSGMTTLVMARACQMNSRGHVFSLENGEEYAQKSRDVLAAYGLSAYATVIHAPLVNYSVNEKDYQWYSLDECSVQDIDMFVIDGPPGFIQKHSRYPALPLLFNKLSDGCQVFLDDAGRQEELEIVQLWQQQLPGCDFGYIELERGCNRGVINRQNL